MIEVLIESVENIVGKAENAGYQHFLLFPQCYQKAFSSGALTLSQTSPGFYLFAKTSLLETLWEKEKLLITSKFSFSLSVFYPF